MFEFRPVGDSKQVTGCPSNQGCVVNRKYLKADTAIVVCLNKMASSVNNNNKKNDVAAFNVIHTIIIGTISSEEDDIE